jgi:hypothetical protein
MCMYKKTCWTTYERSGWVRVRYCRAPMMLWLVDASETGEPSVADSIARVSTGVVVSWHSAIPAHFSRSGDRDPREIRKLTQVSNGKLCTKVTGDRMQKL